MKRSKQSTRKTWKKYRNSDLLKSILSMVVNPYDKVTWCLSVWMKSLISPSIQLSYNSLRAFVQDAVILVKKDYTIAISQIEILLYLPNFFTINGYIITFILYLIFMFSNKVKLAAGYNNYTTPHPTTLPHPLPPLLLEGRTDQNWRQFFPCHNINVQPTSI